MSEVVSIGSVFIAGVLSFFSPCVIPLLPVFFSMFSQEGNVVNKKRVIGKSALFVLGISFSFIILGFGASVFSGMIRSDMFMIVLGSIVILLGIHQMGIIHIPLLFYDKRVKMTYQGKSENLKAFLLGFTFSFGWTPCIGPILGAVLGLSINGENPYYGGFLMAIYALGFLIPFMILAFFSETLIVRLPILQKHMKLIKISSGLVIIFMGILLMSNQLYHIVQFFE